MARIIYKKGKEGQNNLSSIEGIEIDLLNGQKALIYPKYSEKIIFPWKKAQTWNAPEETEIDALRVKDTYFHNASLREAGSPAAEYVHQFSSDIYGQFRLPSLLAAMEIQREKEEIDALAETIEGADLLRNFAANVWSCSRCSEYYCWCAYGGGGFANGYNMYYSSLVVPTILTFPEKGIRKTL